MDNAKKALAVEDKVIFFHDDLDGVFCAALALAKFGEATLKPVASNDRWKFSKMVDNAKSEGFKSISIFDYAFSPKAKIWFDHHPISKEDYHIANNPTSGKTWRYDKDAKSCFGLMVKSYYGYTVPEHIAKLAEGVDMYDSASFPNSNYVFTSTKVLNLIFSALELNIRNRPAHTIIAKGLVNLIANWLNSKEPTSKTLLSKLAVYDFNKNLITEMNYRALLAQRNLTILGDMALLVGRWGEYPRYSEVFSTEKCNMPIKYFLRLEHLPWQRGMMRVSLGVNPYSKDHTLNVGRVLRDTDLCKGGGHRGVGGGLVKEKDMDDFIELMALQLAGEIKEDDMLEKLGVDSGDRFEKSAKELSKEASMNMEDAREQLRQQEEDKNNKEASK